MLRGHCPACLPPPCKLEKIAVFSSFALTTNRIEIASSLEHTIVCTRQIAIVSANERTPVLIAAVTYRRPQLVLHRVVRSEWSSEPTDQRYDMPDPVFSFITALPNVGT